MTNLINYKDFEDKGNSFNTNSIINDEAILDAKIAELRSCPQLVYRGVNNAAFRLYTSAQRHFIWQDEIFKKYRNSNFHKFIRNVINAVYNDSRILYFFQAKNVPINDFLILALLQHYAECSPLLDFAYDIDNALFFAQDNYSPITGVDKLEDYISLYFTSRQIDWMQTSIESINQIGALKADEMIVDAMKKNNIDIEINDAIHKMINLTYEDYIDGISFIPVGGANIGITNVFMKSLGIGWQYNITNPRLQKQAGMFIFNVSDNVPLVEQVNAVTKFYKIFGCINIHKRLIPHIQAHYLSPRNLSREIVYLKTEESNQLEEMVKALF